MGVFRLGFAMLKNIAATLKNTSNMRNVLLREKSTVALHSFLKMISSEILVDRQNFFHGVNHMRPLCQ